MRLPLVALLLILAPLVGCVAPAADPAPVEDDAGGHGVTLTLAGRTFEADAHRAGLSHIELASGEATDVTFPAGVLLLDGDRGYLPATEAVRIEPGAMLMFVPPYGATSLDITLGGEPATLTLGDDGDSLVSGRFAVDELARQRDMFPHRTPGMPNYGASLPYFAAFFESLGMEVEVDPFGLMATDGLPGAGSTKGSSMTNVVGIKRGTLFPERYLVVGGHFDVVPGTTEGAFDNTGGTVATMALARAFANVTTQHTLIFGLWGGEENGILGSQFWVQTNPDKVPFIDGYYNFDVSPLAWPAPKLDPAPLIVSAGPDGAADSTLFEYATTIKDTWLQLPEAEFLYEPIAQGQAAGAGVNAQSDHTPFMAKGIPVYFPFTSRVSDVFAIIHDEIDTLDNLTKYALYGIEGMANADLELTPEERAEGEDLLARSFETNMWLAFYWFTLTDAGVLEPALAPPAAMLPGALSG